MNADLIADQIIEQQINNPDNSNQYLQAMFCDPEYKQLLTKHIKQQLTIANQTNTNHEETMNTEQQVYYQQLSDAYKSDNYRQIQKALKQYKQYTGQGTCKLNAKKDTLKQAILEALKQLTIVQAIESETPGDEVTANEVLNTIQELDIEHKTNNYLPIYLVRQHYPQLTRQEMDDRLYQLQSEDKIQLSTLQEPRLYTTSQLETGIQRNVGGVLFFIIQLDKEFDEPTQPIQPAPKTEKPTYNRKHYLKGKLSSLLTPQPRHHHQYN